MSAREQGIAARVVEWLQAEQWDVYQEVQPYQQGRVCDIVAVQGRLTWAIEVKASFGLAVLEQATGWINWANFVSVATPPSRTFQNSRFCRRGMLDLGIGGIVVHSSGEVKHWVRPALKRRIVTSLRDVLRDEHKTWAPAGSTGSRHLTAFKITCREVYRFAKSNPGADLKVAIDSIPHHYANDKSARGNLLHWLEAGKVAGVEMRREGRRVRLYPAEGA